MKKIGLILIALILYTLPTKAGLFDDRYPSARATGMSNTLVALPGDVWAAYYNPAGLAKLDGYQMGASYSVPFNLSFFNNYFLAANMALPEGFGSAGISVQSFGVKFEGNSLSDELTLALSHGFMLMEDIHSSLSFGYNLKYYYWDLGESVGGIDLGSAGSFGLDLGFQASLYSRTTVGVYFMNANAPTIGAFDKYDLPQRIVIGAAYLPQNGVTTTIAMNKVIGQETEIQGGFEFELMDLLTLRFGASTDPNRFSGGLGIHYHGFHFDYALRTHPVLPETHQFGIRYMMGE